MPENAPAWTMSCAYQDDMDSYRGLPSVDRLLRDPRVTALAGVYGRASVAGLVRKSLNSARQAIRLGGAMPAEDSMVREVLLWAKKEWRNWPQKLVNATGVVLHTNLGRAPLSDAALEAAVAAASGYSDLEFDLESGKRGSRQTVIGRLISDATGAATGLAVNNNASAVLLVLGALATGREVIVSRGEAVEIGGGFRVPDVMRQSGATLVEVGTTNRTYARDYESAINERTAAILKVHSSNFTVTGFTHFTSLEELTDIGRRKGVPVLHDLGSGCLLDTASYGMAHEPTVQESIGSGVNLTMFSGDKLLGGPQAGIIAGDGDLVARVERHPLARATRIDKMTLGALSATLLSYIRGKAEAEIPVWRMIAVSPNRLKQRSESWKAAAGVGEVVNAQSAIGGGSLPGQSLPSFALRIWNPAGGCEDFAARLRAQSVPVIGRIEDDAVLLDPRTVLEDQDELVVRALEASNR